ncbi:hypothetical protein CLOHYLEM_07411 [[Clostridium] hylemonae DSM 15053]|uniref:Uncharacterized protein n=1 Tax=[Clostridium] hylemonae DSM 15053 TaxID=553973 RepID=C0C5M3_9FIRM|nr:hypothetical protein CLOHYLEM_07411 [[Clostridium] hylemonae DSM 15053]
MTSIDFIDIDNPAAPFPYTYSIVHIYMLFLCIKCSRPHYEKQDCTNDMTQMCKKNRRSCYCNLTCYSIYSNINRARTVTVVLRALNQGG